jgi:cysteine-rich repeat protein
MFRVARSVAFLVVVVAWVSTGAGCGDEESHILCGNGQVDPGAGETCDNGISSGQPGACLPGCDDGDACTDDAVTGGSEAACTLQCTHTPRGAVAGDGCCPAGAEGELDADCTGATCGDGEVGGSEQCDTGIAQGEPGACPPIAACDDDLPCTIDSLEGEGCQAHCEHAVVTDVSGDLSDGCCPTGVGTSETDVDCPASCGNGIVDLGETCDSGITSGDGKCPVVADCDDHVACTTDSISGGGCTERCLNQAVTQPSGNTADACCPPGGNANTDTDCQATCGNGAVEEGERCDVAIAGNLAGHCPSAGECNDQDTCTDDSLTGAGTCGARCVHAERGVSGQQEDGCCPSIGSYNTDADCPAVCGNAVLEAGAGEACDTGIPGGRAGHCPADASECNDTDACTTDGVTGTGCARQCTNASVTQCKSASDGCCPAGCNANSDADCSPSCGNGSVEGNETCDTTIAHGQPGACPVLADCNDQMACTADALSGSGCNTVCVHAPIVDPSGTTADGCCPEGADSTTDADCPVVCGNGLVETGEKCDTAVAAGQPGACPTLASCSDADTCTTDGLTGAGTCQATCAPHAPIMPCCGNGAVEAGETCDTAIPSGANGACPQTCDDLNPCTEDASTGTACTAACTHVAITPCCGNGLVEAGETCDTAIPSGAGTCGAITCVDGIDCTSDTSVNAGGNACKKICPHSPIHDPGGEGTTDGCCPPQSRFGQDADCACGNGSIEAATFEQCDDGNATNDDACTSSCTTGGGLRVGSPCTMDADCSALGASARCATPGTLGLDAGWVHGYCTRSSCDPSPDDTDADGTPQNVESCPQQDADALCIPAATAGASVPLCLALCNTTHGQNDCRRVESGPVPGGWAYRCAPLGGSPSTRGVCIPRDAWEPSL